MRPVPLVVAGLVLAAITFRWGRLSRQNRALGAMFVIALAVYGSGVVHFPNLEAASRQVGKTLGSYTYLPVGVLAFLETGAGIGLIAPGELAVVIGGCRRRPGTHPARLADPPGVGVRVCGRHSLVPVRPLARPRVPDQTRAESQAHPRATRAGRAVLRPARRQDDPRRPLPRARACARAVRSRRVEDGPAAIPPVLVPRRRRVVSNPLDPRLRLLAILRPGRRDRQARHARARRADGIPPRSRLGIRNAARAPEPHDVQTTGSIAGPPGAREAPPPSSQACAAPPRGKPGPKLTGLPKPERFEADRASGDAWAARQMVLDLLITMALVPANGFFVASEFSLARLRPTQSGSVRA